MRVHSYNYNGINSVLRREPRATNPGKYIKPIVREKFTKRLGQGLLNAGKEAIECGKAFAVITAFVGAIFPFAAPIMSANDIEKDKVIVKELVSPERFKTLSDSIAKINSPLGIKQLTAWNNVVNSLKRVK